MGEKAEVMEAVLKEAVDLVTDLSKDLRHYRISCLVCIVLFLGFVNVAKFFQENIPIEEVFEHLRCSKEGLNTQAAEERLAIFGQNKLEEKKARFCRFFALSLTTLTAVTFVFQLRFSKRLQLLGLF